MLKNLIDCVPIEKKNYLLHAMIGICNKTLSAYFKWIDKISEIITDEELCLINQRNMFINQNDALKMNGVVR